MKDLVLFTILIILILVCTSYLSSNEITENFETYFYDPFNYGSTGSDPLSFYKYPIYRKPYRYPFQFESSYPSPYLSYYPTNI
tara:strand:+ start:179 stop:427 length:249 start_codon:yes stop_codon:yes gene_type:complete